MLEELRAGTTSGTYAGGERVLVAVSEQPGVEMLVRTAKRLADALHAPWTAVHVETPRTERLGASDREQLSAALGLDSTLGRSEEHTSELQSLMRTPYAVFCVKTK